MSRVGFLGPLGTFSHEAVLSVPGADGFALIPLPTIGEVIRRVDSRLLDYGVVPIENSIDGSVNVTLDALAFETENLTIAAESVQGISQCLIARSQLALDAIQAVISHPTASGQCARFLAKELPRARLVAANSTADAVRQLTRSEEPWAAIGNQVAAEEYGGVVLRAAIEDEPGNQTRFVWLASGDAPAGVPGSAPAEAAGWKTALVFWGQGSDAAGWLVACLSELSSRGVNMTRIESRPLKRTLGEYIFFVDCDGRADEPPLVAALEGLRRHVHVLRVLGSFPAA